MAFLLLLLACHRPDPELASQREALLAWERGAELLADGEATAAREAFRAANRARPEDPLLLAWEAQAAAEDGHLLEAIALLDQALASNPRFGEGRYHRAVYHARAGNPAAAAEDLAQAVRRGAVSGRQAASDPDFAPWLDHPAFAFLPDPISVAVDAPEGAVFLGSPFSIRLRVAGAEGLPIAITPEHAEGPLELLGVVEDLMPSTDGPFRDLVWTWRATEAGEAVIGPLLVQAGPRRATVAPVQVVAKAPPDRPPSTEPLRTLRLATPQEVSGRVRAPGTTSFEGALVVVIQPGDRVELDPPRDPAEPVVAYELRERGQTRWIALHHPQRPPDPQGVRILRAGQVVWEHGP